MNFWCGLYDSGKYWDRGEYEQDNLCYPTIGDDGRTSYNFVQILKRFDIMTDFKTKKSTKRLYSAVVCFCVPLLIPLLLLPQPWKLR